MAYYTAVNSKMNYNGKKLIHEDEDGFSVYVEDNRNVGRLYLVKNNIIVGCLISGVEGLNKYYKGSYDVWKQHLKEKDLIKIKSIENKIKELNKDIEFFKSIWRD